jgi:hypothetical protein
MSVVRNLLVRAGADFSAMRKGLNDAASSVKNFSRSVKNQMNFSPKFNQSAFRRGMDQTKNTVSRSKDDLKSQFSDVFSPSNIGLAALTYGIVEFFKQSSKEAMRLESAVSGVNRMMGDSANTFKQWTNNSALAFNLSKSDAMDYGRSFSSMIAGFATDSKQVEKYTENILKASAVIASGSGRTIDDVVTRLMSGLRGETDSVEDLSIYVNQSMIKNTAAFKRFAGNKSWADLSYQTQQQILYFAELEQATKVYGTTLADTTAGRLAQFSANLRNMQADLGKSINVLANSFLPALTSIVNGISQIMSNSYDFGYAFASGKTSDINNQTAAMMNQQQAMSDYNQQMSDYNSRMKSYKDGIKGAAAAQKNMIAGFDEVNQLADKQKNFLDAPEKPKKPNLSDFINNDPGNNNNNDGEQSTGSKIGKAFNDFFKLPDPQEIEKNKKLISDKLNGWLDDWDTFWNVKVPEAFVNGWEWFKNKDLFKIDITFPDTSGFTTGLDKFKTDASTKWNDFLSGFGKFGESTKTNFNSIADQLANSDLIKNTKKNASDLWDNITGVFNDAKTGVSSFFSTSFTNIGSALSKIDLKASTDAAWTKIKSVFNDTKTGVSSFFTTSFGDIKTALTNLDVKTSTDNVWTKIKNVFNNTKTGVSTFFSDIWKNITDAFDNKDFLKSIGTAADGVWTKIKSSFQDASTWFDTNVATPISTAIEKIKSAFSGGIVDGLKTILNQFIDTLNKGFTDFNSFKNNLPGGSYIPNIPQIPKLARGGIVDSPTIAQIGESGKEMIVPLENTSFTDQLASALGSAVMAAMQMTSGSNNNQRTSETIIKIDGVSIARAITPYLTKESSRVGNAMIKIN